MLMLSSRLHFSTTTCLCLDCNIFKNLEHVCFVSGGKEKCFVTGLVNL